MEIGNSNNNDQDDDDEYCNLIQKALYLENLRPDEYERKYRRSSKKK
jgi:hypothetical protein